MPAPVVFVVDNPNIGPHNILVKEKMGPDFMTTPKGKIDIHVWLDPELAESLRAMAKENGLSLTAQARMMLRESIRSAQTPNYQQERVNHA